MADLAGTGVVSSAEAAVANVSRVWFVRRGGVGVSWLFEDAVRHMALVSEASTTPVLCKTFAPRRVIAY